MSMWELKYNFTRRISKRNSKKNKLRLDGNIVLSMQKRSNRFSNNKSKTGSPAQSNSSDSQNKTKFSTNRKASNRSPNSTERYLISEECNIPTESSQ